MQPWSRLSHKPSILWSNVLWFYRTEKVIQVPISRAFLSHELFLCFPQTVLFFIPPGQSCLFFGAVYTFSPLEGLSPPLGDQSFSRRPLQKLSFAANSIGEHFAPFRHYLQSFLSQKTHRHCAIIFMSLGDRILTQVHLLFNNYELYAYFDFGWVDGSPVRVWRTRNFLFLYILSMTYECRPVNHS